MIAISPSFDISTKPTHELIASNKQIVVFVHAYCTRSESSRELMEHTEHKISLFAGIKFKDSIGKGLAHITNKLTAGSRWCLSKALKDKQGTYEPEAA